MGMTARQGSYSVNHVGQPVPPDVGQRREAYEDEVEGLAREPRASSTGQADKEPDMGRAAGRLDRQDRQGTAGFLGLKAGSCYLMCHPRLWEIVTVLLLATAICAAAPAAAGGINVFLAGEAGDRDAAPRQGRLHNAVVDELSAVLQDQGFAVYDEATATPNGLARGAGDAQLIAAVQSLVRPPVDVAVLFSVRARAKDLSYSKKISTQVTARMFGVATGRHIGNLRAASPNALRTPLDCEGGCLAAAFERDARRLSRQLGRELALRLASVLDAEAGTASPSAAPGGGMPVAYTIVFEDFSAAEVFEIEEYLVVFSGYRRHRPISTGHGRHEYWYETASARGRLNRNLNKMLDYLDMPGQVDLSGNVFTVTKTAAAGETARSWDDW